VASLFADIDDVTIHVVRVETVDADRNALACASPIEIVESLDDVLAGLFFFRRRNGVFAVEEHIVGGALQRALDHGGVGARNSQIRTLQALFAGGVKRVAH